MLDSNRDARLAEATCDRSPVRPAPVVERAAEAHDAFRQVRVSVIVPTLNEAPNLPYVLPRIPAWVDEVLLVDGGSVDGTVEVART